jgi:high-affinity Fe2+/Pb2+ permease
VQVSSYCVRASRPRLVVGIVLAFLDRTGRRDGFAAVWAGVAAALAVSLVVGIALFAAGADSKAARRRSSRAW